MAAPTFEFAARRGLLVPVDALPEPTAAVVPPAVPSFPEASHERETTPVVEPVPVASVQVDGLPTGSGKSGKPSRRERREARAQEARTAWSEGRTRRVGQWTARAAEARRLRKLLLDPNVQAVRLMRQRARWTVMAWASLVFSMAFTAVNVQAFASVGSQRFAPMWWVAWAVDPAFSILLVGVLIARGGLAQVGHQMHDRVLQVIEYGLLGAITVMNVMPTITHRYDGGLLEQIFQVVLHMAIPALAFAAALALPVIQRHFAEAIDALDLSDDDEDRPEGFRTAINFGKQAPGATGEKGLPEKVQELLVDVRKAIADGTLTPDPIGHVIYKQVMGGRGNRARAYEVARLVAGWRPALRAVDGGQAVTR